MPHRSLRIVNSQPVSALDVLDEIDLEILRLLVSDGRRPFNQIAKELGVSDVTIKTRIKRLSATGILKGFAPIIDYEKLGYGVSAFIELKIVPGSLDEVLEVLERIPEVVDLYELHSHCDLLVKVKARTLDDLRTVIVDKIRYNLKRRLVSDDSSTILRTYIEGSNLSARPWGTRMPELNTVARGKVKLTAR
jgi:Lrp/AsnC family transcriptional regulator for asnA, asnC and gidA